VSTLLPITNGERIARYGRFRFTLDPQAGNPEHIRILDGWAEANLVSVRIPQLPGRLVVLHTKAVEQFRGFFAELESEGLLPLVRSYNGSWVPRFKRQAGTPEERAAKCRTLGPASLSNHAWGTSLDLDAKTRPLGQPLRTDDPWIGTVERVANNHDIFWGGRFRGRVDSMHFEVGVRR
jgi:hypothetical protein